MKWRSMLAMVVAVAAACTQRNPEYCGDGTCVDPSKPFCDIDGSFAGIAGTCIAVSCTPGEFESCRGDLAITCNAMGTSFDLLQCEMGCDPDASGCKQCSTNAQCTATDVCDLMTSHCRGCRADDECASFVCDVDTGKCVSEDAVLYVAPGGLGNCSRTQPCWMAEALGLAVGATPMPIVRLLPGNYTETLHAKFKRDAAIRVVATGANLASAGQTAAIVVDDGAKLDIRNLSSTSERVVQCGLASTSTLDPTSTVRLRDSSLTAIGASSLAFETQRCVLEVTNVEVSATNNVITTRDDSTFKADRLYVRGSQGASWVFFGKRTVIEIANSVLDNVSFARFNDDTGPPGTSIKFAFTTIMVPSIEYYVCGGDPQPHVSTHFENSILAVGGANDVFQSTATCTFSKALMSRQSSPPSGSFVADPKFVDLSTRDFHLSIESPAIDAAIGGSIPATDLEGTPRPQGAGADLGAYELRP